MEKQTGAGTNLTQAPGAQVQAKRAPLTLGEMLQGESFKKQIAMALPKMCSAERFIRVVMTQIHKNPKILNCTKESVLMCLYRSAEVGIEPDGRRAHLIPYGNECTLIFDYKGLAELAMRSGVVSNIHADKICENDEFEFDRGQITKHKIDFRKDRGAVYAYYVLIRMKDGGEKAEVMSLKEVETIRDEKSSGYSAFKLKKISVNPWDSDPDEMGKKTVFRRASKWLTLSAELRRAQEFEEDPTALPAITLETPADVTDIESPTPPALGQPEANDVPGKKAF